MRVQAIAAPTSDASDNTLLQPQLIKTQSIAASKKSITKKQSTNSEARRIENETDPVQPMQKHQTGHIIQSQVTEIFNQTLSKKASQRGVSVKGSVKGSKKGSAKGGESSKEDASEEEDNYMELFVKQELKDKLDPLEEKFKESNQALENMTTQTKTRIDALEERIAQCNTKYDGSIRAMLSKQGVKLTEINEYNILREFMRLAEREEQLR